MLSPDANGYQHTVSKWPFARFGRRNKTPVYVNIDFKDGFWPKLT
jgi:hypothetical protein